MNHFLWAMLVTFVILILPTTIVLSPFIVKKLAELEKFWATCQEGQARPVTWNKQFSKFIMSYAGFCFEGELAEPKFRRNEAEYWEVVKDTRPQKKKSIKKLFDGIYKIGLPPFAEIQRYKMTWIEWGYPKKADGTVSIEKTPIPHEEIISHILVQDDVYFVRILSAETSEGVPFDISFLLTIKITNPYKAMYRVQHWLEAVTNQTEGTTRVFIGTKKASELFTLEENADTKAIGKGGLSPTSSEKLLDALKERLADFKKEYGVSVHPIQIQAVEPGGSDAKKYRELLTRKYEAEKEAERTRIVADAEAYKIKKIAEAQKEAATEVFGAVAAIPGGQGPDMYHSQQVGGLQGLKVYTEGDRKNKGNNPVTAISTDIE